MNLYLGPLDQVCIGYGLVPNRQHIIVLTHWGRVTHICVSELNIIGSDNGLSPGRRQAIIWNNAGLLLIEPLGTNVSEISIGIHTFSFKKMHLNVSSAKWHPFCLGLIMLTNGDRDHQFMFASLGNNELMLKSSQPPVTLAWHCWQQSRVCSDKFS